MSSGRDTEGYVQGIEAAARIARAFALACSVHNKTQNAILQLASALDEIASYEREFQEAKI